MADYKFSVILRRIFIIFSIGSFQNTLLLHFLAFSRWGFCPGQSQIFSPFSPLHPGPMKISPNACFQLPSSKVSPHKRWFGNFVVLRGLQYGPACFADILVSRLTDSSRLQQREDFRALYSFLIVLVCSEMVLVFF